MGSRHSSLHMLATINVSFDPCSISIIRTMSVNLVFMGSAKS